MLVLLLTTVTDPHSDSVVTHIITLLESVNASAGVNKLLLAREERVAVRADINSEVVAR